MGTPPTHPHTYIISTMASSMMALRSLARTAAPRAAVRQAASLAVARRFASSSSTQQDPKAKANALIDALPGNSLVSKTGILTLGTAISAVAISKELFVVNEEVVVLASFTILIAFLAKIIRAPYSEWAESQIDRVGEMKDVVGLTEQLFALSKETAQLEHETFVLAQPVADIEGLVKAGKV